MAVPSCESQGMLEFRDSINGSMCSCSPGLFFMPMDVGWGRCVNLWENVSRTPSETSAVLPTRNLHIFSALSNANSSTFIWTTIAVLGLWLILTVPLVWFGLTRGFLFRVRVALTAWDYRYSTRHWLDDRKYLLRRSTELGGMLTIASWVLFTGLTSSLAYNAISSETFTIQYLTPAKRRDIEMFRNDIEINVTTVGQLQCNQIMGTKLFLSSDDGIMINVTAEDFSKPSCVDTAKGPLFRIFCRGCVVESDRYLFMWEFQDQLNASIVASAVGFEINASATTLTTLKSTLAAILPGGYSRKSASAATMRGSDWNVISLNFVPRIFKSKGDEKLMQIMFHMFTSGSYVVNTKEMQDSFAKNQGVKIALQVNVLSQYLVETTHRSYFGVVKFLGYLGGLYIFCRSVFLIIMFQCERNFPKLLIQEKLLNRLVAKERARAHWAKVRLFVKYGSYSTAGKFEVHRMHWVVVRQKFSGLFRKLSRRSKSKCITKEGPGQYSTERTSGTVSNCESNVARSPFFIRQYRKPTWIHEPEALPPVPEPPDSVSYFNEECEEHAYLHAASEYLENMYLYSTRLRRDYLATLTVLEKVAWHFEVHKT